MAFGSSKGTLRYGHNGTFCLGYWWKIEMRIGNTGFHHVGKGFGRRGRLSFGMEGDLEGDDCGVVVLGLTVSLELR